MTQEGIDNAEPGSAPGTSGRDGTSRGAGKYSRSGALRVKLSQFEGPLDLLLHLIARAQLDISQIFVSEITAQYLSLMDEAAELDMDRASEFIAMAAQLLYIKSRALLPRPDPLPDEEDPEQALIRQLREYKAYKAAGEKLNEMLLSAGRVYGKLPEEFQLPGQVVSISGATLEQLFVAFSRIITKELQNKAPILREVLRDEYTVPGCIAALRDRLRFSGELRFTELFQSGAGREQLITTFMAVLEMCALGELRVRQDGTFGEIVLCAGANAK